MTTSELDSDTPPHLAHNYRMLVGDVACFFIGIGFLDGATALPALLEPLGGGAVFLGTLLALRQAAYYLPQLLVAHRVQGYTRFKPFLLRVCALGRIWFVVAALGVYLFGTSHPHFALFLLAFAYLASWIGDGSGGVPWTSLVGRMIPDRQRGRLFATTQVISGISRLGVSALVAALLGGQIAPFPLSGALQILFCAVFMGLSWGFLAALRETPTPPVPDADTLDFQAYLRGLPQKFRARPDFASLALVQVLATASVACAPFLVGYAPKVLPQNTFALGGTLGVVLGRGLPGLFLGAATVGLLLFAPLWGGITDRRGPRAALRGVFLVALLCPLFALCAGIAPPGFRLALILAAYVCFGGVQDAWVTITNYLLEATPRTEQPTYVGLMNAASLPALLLPFGAGLLVRGIGETALWVASIAVLGTGFAVASRLPNTRRALSPADGSRGTMER